MYSEEYDPLTDREKRYLRIRQNKFDYTIDDKDKGKAPESGGDEDGKEFTKTLLKPCKILLEISKR